MAPQRDTSGPSIRISARPRGHDRRVPHGRYDGRHEKTRLPPGGELGRPPRSKNHETAVAAITDPLGDGRERILATVNRRVDVLEHERSHKMISEAAYQWGRIVQGVLERSRRIGGSNWAGASRKDPAVVRDAHAQRLIDDGKLAEIWLAGIRVRLGEIDTRLLQRIIGEGKSYEDCAALIGRSGDRGQRYIAGRFRDALEDLAEAWTAKGKAPGRAADAHDDAAVGLDGREAASIAYGVTLGRLEAERDDLMGRRGPRVAAELAEISAQIAALRARGSVL